MNLIVHPTGSSIDFTAHLLMRLQHKEVPKIASLVHDDGTIYQVTDDYKVTPKSLSIPSTRYMRTYMIGGEFVLPVNMYLDDARGIRLFCCMGFDGIDRDRMVTDLRKALTAFTSRAPATSVSTKATLDIAGVTYQRYGRDDPPVYLSQYTSELRGTMAEWYNLKQFYYEKKDRNLPPSGDWYVGDFLKEVAPKGMYPSEFAMQVSLRTIDPETEQSVMHAIIAKNQ